MTFDTCSVCGKPTTGDPHPGADVMHIKCAMKVTRDLRNMPDFYVVGLYSHDGYLSRGVCSDLCDDVWLEATESEDKCHVFYDDAQHLADWAAEKGLRCFWIGYNFDDLPEK